MSEVSALVTSTTVGPRATQLARRGDEVGLRGRPSRPTRNSSSNWFGVTMSACGHDVVAQVLGDARADEEAAPDVAHDRVAAVDRGGVGRLDPRDGVEDDLADRLGALVAGEHGVDRREGAALLDAVDDLATSAGAMSGPRSRAVAGVVGEGAP